MGMTKVEREALQRQRLFDMLKYERELWASGCSYVAGVDEVGRGPLAGPVVTAAVILPADFSLLGVDDSKKLSEKKREYLFDMIKEAALCYAIGRREHDRIDEINILAATKEAMVDAVHALDICPGHVLIDGNQKLPALALPQTTIVHGDANSVSIAAASILAKVTRDREMVKMDSLYPGYGFAQNKGYGTQLHYEGLKNLGPCPIHRKTFITNVK